MSDEQESSSLDCSRHRSKGFQLGLQRAFRSVLPVYDVTQGSNSDSDGSEDVFFHVSEYPSGKATKGEHVQFNIKKTKQGYNAINISHSNSKKSESWDDTFASLRPRWGKDS